MALFRAGAYRDKYARSGRIGLLFSVPYKLTQARQHGPLRG
jgi:hypothetical protein